MATDAGNVAPIFTTRLLDQTIVEGTAQTVEFPASFMRDADGDRITVLWSFSPGGTPPPWMQVSEDSLTLRGTAPVGSPDYVVSVTLTDGQASSPAESFRLITNPQATVNRPPALAVPLLEQAWSENTSGSYAIAASTFSDPDGDPLSWSARLSNGSALPSWLGFDAATKTLSGMPPVGSDDLSIRLTATDPAGLSVSADFLLRTPSSAVITGSNGPDQLDGTATSDSIRALAGNDVVNAGAGDDVIDGGSGADRIDGGSGTDTATYSGSRSDYLLGRNAAGVVTVSDRFGVMDTLVDVEVLDFGTDRVATAGLRYAPASSVPAAVLGFEVFRFYNVRDSAYFYTSSSAERDLVIRESTDPAYTPENGLWPYFYQGSTFGTPTEGTGVVPVYRFYNTQTGHHFFTISSSERDLVRRESTDPTYTPENGVWPFVDEGVGFGAFSAAGQAAAVPVFRFYSPSLNRHFFTASADEAQQMRLTGQWNDEGVGFYAPELRANQAPTLATPLTSQSWREGQASSYQFPAGTFADADGDSLSYTATTTAGGGLPSWLSFAAATRTFSGTPPTGTADISIRVTASDGRIGGTVSADFTVTTPSATSGDDYAASTSTTGRLTVGGSVAGSVEVANDRDWFRVSLTGGHNYWIVVQGEPGSKSALNTPTLAGIYDGAGKSVSSGGSTKMYTPSNSGDYYLSAGASDTSTGRYQVTLTEDPLASRGTTATLAVGGAIVDSIEIAGDQDWFRIDLVQGRRYTINLETTTAVASISDPMIQGIYDANGKSISGTSNDNASKQTRNARVDFTPSSSGTYYIAAAGSGSVTGQYRLSIVEATASGSSVVRVGGVEPLRTGAAGQAAPLAALHDTPPADLSMLPVLPEIQPWPEVWHHWLQAMGDSVAW